MEQHRPWGCHGARTRRAPHDASSPAVPPGDAGAAPWGQQAAAPRTASRAPAPRSAARACWGPGGVEGTQGDSGETKGTAPSAPPMWQPLPSKALPSPRSCAHRLRLPVAPALPVFCSNRATAMTQVRLRDAKNIWEPCQREAAFLLVLLLCAHSQETETYGTDRGGLTRAPRATSRCCLHPRQLGGGTACQKR